MCAHIGEGRILVEQSVQGVHGGGGVVELSIHTFARVLDDNVYV